VHERPNKAIGCIAIFGLAPGMALAVAEPKEQFPQLGNNIRPEG
jgi:hypothetical protein